MSLQHAGCVRSDWEQVNGANVLKALLWDVDGTLAETERDVHRVAFNRAFEARACSGTGTRRIAASSIAATTSRSNLDALLSVHRGAVHGSGC